MMRLYIVTGANGHLGGTIVRMLQKKGAPVRGLIPVSYTHLDVYKRQLVARTPIAAPRRTPVAQNNHHNN